MCWRDLTKASRKKAVAIALTTGLTICLHASAGDAALESARLGLLLRQLDMLDRTAQQAAASAVSDSRYRFNYARLHADIARVRAGIEDYLAPPRAQPRDPQDLSGDYRADRSVEP